MPRAGRPEHGDGRPAERRRDVHQPRIVGNDRIAAGEREDRLAQIIAGEVSGAVARGLNDLRGRRLFARAADDPHMDALSRKGARKLGIMRDRPCLSGPDRARGERHHRPRGLFDPAARPPSDPLGRRHDELGQRKVGRSGGPVRQGKGDATVDHARKLALAEAQIVDEAEPPFAEHPGAHWDAGKAGRERRLPLARHHQCLAVALQAQPRRKRPVFGEGQAIARQVADDPFAHARHVVEQRRGRFGGEQVDRAVGFARLDEPHDRMATHEVAEPHVRDDEDRGVGAAGVLR